MMLNEYTQILFLNENSFDENNFKIEKHPYKKVVLRKDRIVEGDGIIWGMQRATIMKAHYSEKEIMEDKLVSALPPIKHGEVVAIVDLNDKSVGGFYKMKYEGDYSCCCTFDKICDFDGKLA